MRICLITPGQPSINPRLVKEADALQEAGHDVHVLCSHYVRWADEADRTLLASRAWKCTYVGGDPSQVSVKYYWTRARHSLARRVLSLRASSSFVRHRALARVAPELVAAALETPADLYIAHYAGALPGAATAARKYRARLGFDAEDFESGGYLAANGASSHDQLLRTIEARYLPECNYITASSSGIAQAYAESYGVPLPTTILNVFPLAQRPHTFRPASEGRPLMLYWFSQTIGLDRGLGDAVRAMGLLRGCRIELHIRGEIRDSVRRNLFSLAAASGVSSQQIRLHSPRPSEEMIRLAAEHDVGLALEQPASTNRDICLTNKIFTYLLAGNAIAATATTGQLPVMIRVGDAGFCCAPGDVQTLARGLRRWYEDRAALNQARQQAWFWGSSEYNWDIEKQKLVKIILQALTEIQTSRNFCRPGELGLRVVKNSVTSPLQKAL